MAGFRPGLAEVQSLADPQLSYNWNILIPFIPGAADTRKLSYKAISTSLPGSEIEQVTLEHRVVKLQFAGRRIYSGQWSVTMFETRDLSTRDDLIRWMDLCRSYHGNTGSFKQTYAVTAELQLFDDTPKVNREIRLLGLFPLKIEDATLDSSSSILQYSINFSFDSLLENQLTGSGS